MCVSDRRKHVLASPFEARRLHVAEGGNVATEESVPLAGAGIIDAPTRSMCDSPLHEEESF